MFLQVAQCFCFVDVKYSRHSPVEEFVVGVLSSLHVSADTINDLNQLLQLLLQRLQESSRRSIFKQKLMKHDDFCH